MKISLLIYPEDFHSKLVYNNQKLYGISSLNSLGQRKTLSTSILKKHPMYSIDFQLPDVRTHEVENVLRISDSRIQTMVPNRLCNQENPITCSEYSCEVLRKLHLIHIPRFFASTPHLTYLYFKFFAYFTPNTSYTITHYYIKEHHHRSLAFKAFFEIFYASWNTIHHALYPPPSLFDETIVV